MDKSAGPNLRLNNSEIWGGVIGFALGVFVIWSGIKLKIGTINDPGSGYVPFYTGILMCIFSIAIIYAALKYGGPTFKSLWAGTRWTKPVLVIACLVIFSLLLDRVGFLLSAIPLMFVLLRVVDPVRWVLTIPIAILTPLGAWWVLKHLLHIQLPAGIFEIG